MSLRAIRKRENQLTPSSTQTRKTLYKKQTILSTTPQQNKVTKLRINGTTAPANEGQSLQFGRRALSNPELRTCGTQTANDKTLIRTKSANDIHTLLKDNNRNNNNKNKRPGEPHTNLINAKSEVCLQTIATHSYVDNHNHKSSSKMMRSGQVNRELSQSTYGLSTTGSTPPGITVTAIGHGHGHRRMSECSSSDAYSQRTSSISASDLTLSSPTPMPRADANTVLRVPIIGYEVMEERARFTVYKLRVENPITNDCWLVLRRYTDFVRLNTKLKQAFPYINLMLPRKKLFGDNFNSVFLDNRVQGLQIFVNSIMAKDELRRSEQVREFFCLDEPPSYSESMEECRAIFEAQEETIAHLKMQIQSKNELILSLQQKVREEIQEKEQLRQALRNMALPRSNNQ